LFWGLRGEVEEIWGDDNLLQGKGKAVHVVKSSELLQGERVKALTWLKRNASVILEKLLYELKLQRTSLKFQRNVFWPWRKIHFASRRAQI